MYGIGWLILWALLALAGGIAIGVSIGRVKAGRTEQRSRELETELASARQELTSYRAEVASQFRETAQKFQSLNDAYTDLHVQLARSSSLLCGDTGGPLLRAPQGHQDLITGVPGDGDAVAAADPADRIPDPRTASAAEDTTAEEPVTAEPAAQDTVTAEPAAAESVDPEPAAADPLVAEPGTAEPESEEPKKTPDSARPAANGAEGTAEDDPANPRGERQALGTER